MSELTGHPDWPEPLASVKRQVESRHGVRMAGGHIDLSPQRMRGAVKVVAEAEELIGMMEDIDSALREHGVTVNSGSFERERRGWCLWVKFERQENPNE